MLDLRAGPGNYANRRVERAFALAWVLLAAIRTEDDEMKLRLTCLALAIVIPVLAHAQTTIDMARITCGQYLAMSPSMASDFSAWMSGWIAFQERRTFIDVLKYQKNVQSVRSWCQNRPQAGVMDALKSAIGQ